jgi:hypothetical protein
MNVLYANKRHKIRLHKTIIITNYISIIFVKWKNVFMLNKTLLIVGKKKEPLRKNKYVYVNIRLVTTHINVYMSGSI